MRSHFAFALLLCFAVNRAIYEAADLWGPWATIFDTAEWDTGPGETASFPAKWITADGRTLHLVFSGNDSFSVRRLQFILGPQTDTTTTTNK
jgi:hypothetical protein